MHCTCSAALNEVKPDWPTSDPMLSGPLIMWAGMHFMLLLDCSANFFFICDLPGPNFATLHCTKKMLDHLLSLVQVVLLQLKWQGHGRLKIQCLALLTFDLYHGKHDYNVNHDSSLPPTCTAQSTQPNPSQLHPYAMLCYSVLGCAVLCYAMPCYHVQVPSRISRLCLQYVMHAMLFLVAQCSCAMPSTAQHWHAMLPAHPPPHPHPLFDSARPQISIPNLHSNVYHLVKGALVLFTCD